MDKINATATDQELKPMIDEYSGVAVDIADNEDVTAAEVKDYTCMLNNNPRNNE